MGSTHSRHVQVPPWMHIHSKKHMASKPKLSNVVTTTHTNHTIKTMYINTVKGYVRAIGDIYMVQDVIDLIVFFCAKPMAVNVKHGSEIKPIVCPIETDWNLIESEIYQVFPAFTLSKYDSLKLIHKHGNVNRSNWTCYQWDKEDIFTCATQEFGKFDDALRRYYKLMGVEYSNQFTQYCEENGFDVDDLEEEMDAGHSECMLVDFDNDIPFKQEPKDKTKAIFDVLMKIYVDPTCDFHEPLQITKDDFKIDNDYIKQIRSMYTEQMVTVFNYGRMGDFKNISKILAISEKRQVPYLLYLIDMFSRDRIAAHKYDNKNLQPSDWMASNKHCCELKNEIGTNAKDSVQHAITSFFHSVIPKLMLSTKTQICDDLEITCEYILKQVDLVYNLAQKGNKRCPFQLDALIAYNNAVKLTEMVSYNDHYYDSKDDDSEDDGYIDSHVYRHRIRSNDVFGDVKCELKNEKLLHYIGVIDEVQTYKINYEMFKQQQMQKKYRDKEYEEYPRNHRFCSFIDRRKSPRDNNSNKDEVIFFEPNNCNTIPNNAPALWYFDSNRTTLVPNNINSAGANGALVFISFHVLSIKEIKAYFYINGQMSRFFPSDIIDILPIYFKPNERNKAFVKSQAAKDLIRDMKPKLRDLKFEAFYNEYQYKKK